MMLVAITTILVSQCMPSACAYKVRAISWLQQDHVRSRAAKYLSPCSSATRRLSFGKYKRLLIISNH